MKNCNVWQVGLLVPMLTIVLVSSSRSATVPPLSIQELADRVELRDNKIQRLQVSFHRKDGKVSAADIAEGRVPDSGSVTTAGECAISYPDQIRYLKTAQLIDGKPLPREVLGRGSRWIDLQADEPGNADRWRAQIQNRAPSPFGAGPVDVAARVGRVEIMGLSVPEALRQAINSEVTVTMLGDVECYRVVFLAAPKVESVVGGRVAVAEQATLQRVWLAPSYGMCLIRIEELDIAKPPDFTGKAGLASIYSEAAQALSIELREDLREVLPGVWLPHRITRYSGGRRAQQVTINSIAVNDAANIKKEIDLPINTSVVDETTNLRYRVGINPKAMDQVVAENLSGPNGLIRADSVATAARANPGSDSAPLGSGSAIAADGISWQLITLWVAIGIIGVALIWVVLAKRNRHSAVRE